MSVSKQTNGWRAQQWRNKPLLTGSDLMKAKKSVKMSSHTTKRLIKSVRPILSLDYTEARLKVISLYKAWHRNIPYILKHHDIPFNENQCKQKLREEFTKYDNIKDLRVIDMLIIRGKMDLDEATQKWVSKRGIAKYFKDHMEPKSDCFLDNFLDGKN